MGHASYERFPARILLMVLLVSNIYAQFPAMAARPIVPRDWWSEDWSLFLESLPKGPTTPSEASGCTSNPVNNGGICPDP
ncbi:hypothetical protein MA16_Dca005828 [Dendrobium catenatum]|uniref:Uncharacterized protein n=1 Tax=Dendrobium catenatum TaxID=906689 RepID=A0A2I0WXC7_9ASPA|nr:hypothetical protein MA16_Dca005828 [Dendrobium catenatum]